MGCGTTRMKYFIKFTEQTQTYKNAVLAVKEVIASHGEDWGTRVCAEALAEIRLKAMISKDLKPYGGHICYLRLFNKRCPSYRGVEDGHICLPPFSDHNSLWGKDGDVTTLVSQPYGLYSDNLKAMLEFGDKKKLEFHVDAWPSWHFPGSVVTVMWTKKEAGE